jgi:hypothetical protein
VNPSDRTRLTTALRDHVAKIAADLRIKLRVLGPARLRAEQLYADERVAEDFEVWTDLLSRRAAVLWVLKSVYVRVLEDRGLLSPGRLLDNEAQQLFERLAPHLGEAAFLRWIYRDLASPHGGVPELFSPQPAEVAVPSDESSRALIAFWRHRDADTGTVWSFADERFEGELMGDLYQELDPVVKDRFALCQTPEFVRGFILDRTLTPALETFGADEVRLLDPACGSGHFLIDGLKRIVAATAAKHSDWHRTQVVAQALERVVGIDLNDYACALARTRLIMTAAELAGVTRLGDAARFHPHVYWADGLEQVEPEDHRQYLLIDKLDETPRAMFTRSHVRAALKRVFTTKFHAVVANPPYIVESDDTRKAYHREKIGKSQRYISAYRQYSLASPFTERCFQLAVTNGFVGIIASNNFMKREFGKPLIEKVLAGVDLTLVVDSSLAEIPFHETATVLIFARNRRPVGNTVRVVMGKKGESKTQSNPSNGLVWSGIVEGWEHEGFENDYVSVVELQRITLSKHPWSLAGGGLQQLQEAIESAATCRLAAKVVDIGRTMHTGLDEAFYVPQHMVQRLGEQVLPLVRGDDVRDWSVSTTGGVIAPYNPDSLSPLEEHCIVGGAMRFLWRNKTLLSRRTDFGKTMEERGLKWFEWSMFFKQRLARPNGIAFPVVAAHNHFAFVRDRRVFNSKAPVIKLAADASENEHMSLLGLLNSSTACFWMKQVCAPKGSATHDVSSDGLKPEKMIFEFSATALRKLPIPPGMTESPLADLARRIDGLEEERSSYTPAHVIAGPDWRTTDELRLSLKLAEEQDRASFFTMVAMQEEIDWVVYGMFGLAHGGPTRAAADYSFAPDRRPFAVSPDESWPELSPQVAGLLKLRRARISFDARIALIENATYKRPWLGRQGIFGRYDRTYAEKTHTALREWLLESIEANSTGRSGAFTVEQVVASIQDNPRVLTICELLTDRRDFDLVQLIAKALRDCSVPSHPSHIYSSMGLLKRQVWERTWEAQRRDELGDHTEPTPPPTYERGDFLKPEYWQFRGKLDVPKERFVAFTEVPNRSAADTLFGWTGWTSVQRLKAVLSIDEDLEDAGVSLVDRAALLDSAWRLLPDVEREDSAVATRLKAELQALVGPDGPSRKLIEDWKQRFPPAIARAAASRRIAAVREEDKDSDNEERDEA